MPRHALVTGANGGLGTRLLLRLLDDGWNVSALIRGGADRLPCHPALEVAHKAGRLAVLDVDLLAYVDRGEPRPLVEGPLDALVNIAGSSIIGGVSDIPLDQYRDLHRLNVEAPYLLVQAHLPQLAAAKGTLVQTSSLSAALPLPWYGVYASTKRALEAWSESLAHEVAPLGIKVVCLQPGAYRTGVTHRMRFVPPDRLPVLRPRFEAFRQLVRTRGLRMAHDPADYADEVARLLDARRLPSLRPIGPGRWTVQLLSWVPGSLRSRLVRWGLWTQLRQKVPSTSSSGTHSAVGRSSSDSSCSARVR